MGNNLIKLVRRERRNVNGNREQIQRSPIFKLNNHCFDELFDYLLLQDLHSLGQTCKMLQQMTGEFFKRNYSAAKFNCLSNGIYLLDTDAIPILSIDKCIQIPGFIQLITWIAIENNVYLRSELRKKHFTVHPFKSKSILNRIKYFKSHVDELKSIKKLTLTNIILCRETVNSILKILPNIEVLELRYCTVDLDFYDDLLKYCKNVRRIQSTQVKFKKKFKWLLQQYEKLEHLEICVGDDFADRIDELCTFFQRNPNIRSFSCNPATLWSFEDALLNSEVQLDTFELKPWDDWFLIEDIWDLLGRLQTHGFYKRLHINVRSILEGYAYELPGKKFLETICLEKLSIFRCNSTFEPISTHLIEYSEMVKSEIANMSRTELLVRNLINVERLDLERGSIDHAPLNILLLIQKLKHLKKINLVHFESEEIIQLERLNEEREKLVGAKKVTIYVPDAVYLATKWATKNGITNFNMIEMKRIHSYESNRSDHTFDMICLCLPSDHM